MPEHFADRLLAAIEAKGSPVCVGIDPVYDRLPDALRTTGEHDTPARLAAVRGFCLDVLDVVAEIVPAVKPQIAYFEVFGAEGMALYFEVVARAKALGLVVIGDVKRGDIGSTARAYAAAHLAGDEAPDSVTVNGYFGSDGIAPFADVAREQGKGLFVLVRTSNPSAGVLQDFTDADGQPLYEHVARHLAEIGRGVGLIGAAGYSAVGAVVGATWPEQARRLRQIMPQQLFLVPGYGAQGATAADCAASFDDQGRGAIVNASRSVLYAHQKAPAGTDWKQAVADATRHLAQDIRSALP